MYVRIARFEGGSAEVIRSEAEEMRKGVEAARHGDPSGHMPSELTRLTRRLEVFADADHGKVAVAVYCSTTEELDEVDRIMAAMSPRESGWGKRVSADTYEVVVDEVTSLRMAS